MLAIIDPEERNAATTITNVSRTAVQSIPPPIASYLIGAALFTEPFIFGGVFKIAYDVAIYLSFRKVKPPEEKKLVRGKMQKTSKRAL
jgi:hypothetical protein